MGKLGDIRGAVAAGVVGALACEAPAGPRVLFVRGADRSGGFFEAGTDAQRTEHLADIDNDSTEPGNHGWFELAEFLRADGFVVEQIAESVEAGAPATGYTDGVHVDLELVGLASYDVVVMGSNNAVYDQAAIDALEDYVHAGGGVLFVSDLAFGRSWNDAPESDQQFLDRFGWTMQQDLGVYALTRAGGDFVAPSHPVLAGVDAVEGEGVSPIVRPAGDAPGVRTTLLVRTDPGRQTRNNDGIPGSVRPVTPDDAAVIAGEFGCGRLAGHFDRNTFFNLNGAGTDLHHLDHARYALNLFRWLGAAGPADLAPPLGRLDYSDIIVFVTAYGAHEPAADLAPPEGVWDFSDVLAFLQGFATGCP